MIHGSLLTAHYDAGIATMVTARTNAPYGIAPLVDRDDERALLRSVVPVLDKLAEL